MKMRLVICFVLVSVMCCSARAFASEKIMIDLASDHVSISTGFTGADVSVFGIKRGAGDVFVALEGPRKDNVVRRKDRILGAWVNRSWMRFQDVLSYYDYALSVPEEGRWLSAAARRENGIGKEAMIFAPKYKQRDQERLKIFQEALVRNKQAEKLYPKKPQDIVFLSEGFFRVDFHLPANVPRGSYNVRAVLVREGRIVSEISKPLRVGQVGLSANINKFAHKNGFTYGLMCVGLALLTGWVSSVIGRRYA
jgi:uncharacterized protein (TIGR02186 family)